MQLWHLWRVQQHDMHRRFPGRLTHLSLGVSVALCGTLAAEAGLQVPQHVQPAVSYCHPQMVYDLGRVFPFDESVCATDLRWHWLFRIANTLAVAVVSSVVTVCPSCAACKHIMF